jgi:hypothetical protein
VTETGKGIYLWLIGDKYETENSSANTVVSALWWANDAFFAVYFWAFSHPTIPLAIESIVLLILFIGLVKNLRYLSRFRW